MKNYVIKKFPFNSLLGNEGRDNDLVLKKNIKDEYTGKDLKVASDILAKKDIIVEQNEYTKERVEVLKLESFKNGWSECEKAQKKLVEQEKEGDMINLLAKIESNLLNIYETIESKYDNLSKDCVELSYVIANKLVGRLSEKFPNEVILDFLGKSLPLLTHANDIKVSVNPENLSHIKGYIDNVSQHSTIKIKLIEDESINVNDCKVDWGNGLIKKDTEKVKEDLESIFKNNL
jgi:flagellar biosynthesis/type III secretory pathway protein FliH